MRRRPYQFQRHPPQARRGIQLCRPAIVLPASAEQQVILFELTAALSPGNSATADVLVWDGGYAIDEDQEITVYDAILGTLRGRARIAGPPVVNGSRGYAALDGDNGHYNIVSMEQKARWIRFALAADMGYSSPSATGSVLTYWDGSNPLPSGGAVTVLNCAVTGGYLFSGLTGNIGLACYDPALDQYRIVQLECPT